MLELRPSCENCNKPLPPESTEAMVCSFECTFCAACVDIIQNICPNCGGGFCPRPTRPKTNWHDDNFLGKYPAATTIRHRPIDLAKHAALLVKLKDISPEDR